MIVQAQPHGPSQMEMGDIPPLPKPQNNNLIYIIIGVAAAFALVGLVFLPFLFSLGAGSGSVPTSCISMPGYICSSLTVKNGAMHFLFGQQVSLTFQNVTVYEVPSGSNFSTGQLGSYPKSTPIPSLSEGQIANVTVSGAQSISGSGSLWAVYYQNGRENYAQAAVFTIR